MYEEIPDWLEESMRKHKENINSLKFKNVDPELEPAGEIFFPDFKDHTMYQNQYGYLLGGDMYKEEHTISLPVFSYYWRRFKDFFKKPFQKRLDRRHKLKHYKSVCKENEYLLKINAGLEHEVWKKGVYLDEAHRLLKIANKDKG